MDYKKIAYGSFYDLKGRVWGVDLFRRTDSAMAARELTFEGSEAAVVEWDEFDLAEPIQGSALTLRIVSEADREWVSLYTVNDGEVAVEVKLDGELWWRGSLDPETYEEPYERADDYTVMLRFSDFGPLKRHQFVVHGEGLVKTGPSIGANLLEIGTVTALSDNGLPANVDLSSAAAPEGMTVADMLGIGASPEAFREDEDTDDFVKAWEGVSALLTASGLRMVQRAGKIVLHNLQGLRDNASTQAEECVWSGDSQTLSADAISSRVVVSHNGDGEDNLIKELRTGREQDDLVKASTYFSRKYGYSSVDINLFKTATWTRQENAWGFFTLRGGLDSVQETDGWMMWAYHTDGRTFGSFIGYDHYSDLLLASPGQSPYFSGLTSYVAATPKTYIHLTDSPGSYNQSPKTGYRIKIEQEMFFDCRSNPFSGDDESDPYQKTQDSFSDTQFIYVLAVLSLRSESGKTYYWTNQHKVYDESANQGNLYASCDFGSGKWSETMEPYWIQFRTKEKGEDGKLIGGGWISNLPFVSRPTGQMEKKKIKYNIVTQKIPDGDYIPLPPERGWLTLEVCNAVRFINSSPNPLATLNAMRWILGKGARISIVDADSNYETPESSESEIKVICNNGAEDPLEISPLLGSGGGYLGCRSIIIDADGRASGKGVPELRTATEAASQLCMRRTKLSGEAYINTDCPLTFTERLQTKRIFLLSKEMMDLQTGWGDRDITELLRTDIEGLEVRRNERVIFEGTADRGGRDGKDAEVYSIVPSVTVVSSQYATRMTGDEPMAHLERYVKHIPDKVGCTVYLTRGADITRTRDGVLTCRIVGIDGKTISERIIQNDGGTSEEVTVPERCSAVEFRLYDSEPDLSNEPETDGESEEDPVEDDTEDSDPPEEETTGDGAQMIAVCTILVSTDGLIYPEYSDGKLNFTDISGDKLLEKDILINNYRDVDCGNWQEGRKYYASFTNLNTGMIERHFVWYFGCKFRCLAKAGTLNPPTWDSPDWEFVEGNPDLRLEWAGSQDWVWEDDPEITLAVNVSLYNQNLNDESRIRWDWKRETWRNGAIDTASDDIWNEAHANIGMREQHLVEADMNYQFARQPDKLIYTVTATLQMPDGSSSTQSMQFEM